jgi:hypothetical protein
MPIVDDPTIPNDSILLRVLHGSWVTNKGGRSRPASFSLIDSNYEASCFISNQASLSELQRLFPGLTVAGIPAAVIRACGFAIERRPGECGPNYAGNPNDHVVVGPPEPRPRNEVQRMAKAIVEDPGVFLLRMLPNS